MSKKLLINLAQPQECRIAVLEGGDLLEVHVERRSAVSQWGNIYKGRVVNVEPSIQAAFVEIGDRERGFLHITDVCPAALGLGNGASGRRKSRRIQDYLSRGQEVVAQITRNGIGDKGPTLSTYLSIPGRHVVLMPHIKKSGVSRKIEDPERRRALRRMISEVRPSRDMGFIVRTAGADLEVEDLRRDIEYLVSLWDLIERRGRETPAVSTLFEEGDIVIRTIRDTWSDDFDEILVDTDEDAARVRRYVDLISGGSAGARVQRYADPEPMFDHFRVEALLDRLYEKRVPLRSGGSLIIESTEALVAIDVNSGRYTARDDIEETALWTNLEAVAEIARQLRLRDLGGVIVIDFIDMRDEKNRRRVEEAFRAEMKRDRARTRVARLSEFGIMELTRQRIGPNVMSITHQPCPSCSGRGMVKSVESVGLAAVRAVQRGVAGSRRISRIEIRVNPQIENEIQNRERRALALLEVEHSVTVSIAGRADVPAGEIDVQYFTEAGSPVRLE